ncbi:hypothetical protein [Streptomyces fractus]|uniref:hypothetical protein n=1 Tax=Streptomyces fractus TaxID=641806 RepID=UPI003CEEA21D
MSGLEQAGHQGGSTGELPISAHDNARVLARQLAVLPWREIPVQDRCRDRGHGREEVREVEIASVDNLLFSHARQVIRIHRKRRRVGTKKWSAETVHAVTDLAAHRADAGEIASWAGCHWLIEPPSAGPGTSSSARA